MISQSGLSVVIGPFYFNLAMMLEMEDIPYVVTDMKGFDWVDNSRVGDVVQWNSLIEIRPSAENVNMAIVDIFLFNNWTNAVVLFPDSPKENQGKYLFIYIIRSLFYQQTR